MGIKIISLVDMELTVPIHGGTVTLPPATLMDAEPMLARLLEDIAPVRRVNSADPLYSDDCPILTIAEG